MTKINFHKRSFQNAPFFALELTADWLEQVVPDIDNLSCSDALDDLYTFYKVGPLLYLQADTDSLIEGFT
jgi:hypothetical protein